MAKIILFVFFLTVLQLGHSLNCWKCNGCETSRNNRETCKSVNPMNEEAVCLTQIVGGGAGVEPIVVKKCEYFPAGTTRYDCKELPATSTIRCNICKSDYCNGSTIKSSIAGILIIAISIQLLSYYHTNNQ